MIHYWITIIKILVLRNFQSPVEAGQTIKRTFKVRFFDCDGLRVMTAWKYPVYMDFMRWELIGRSKLYNAIVKRGLAPTLGSQKIIYRKPLKLWTKFDVVLKTAGWDEKWIYHLHNFEQDGELKAIGITRALIWKRDVPGVLSEIMQEAGISQAKEPPLWVKELYANDAVIIYDNQPVTKI
ncbi:acyl-CoA thioesterase [Eudoraea adriatica]|uniref:acyl-CoA thioesterase n=1 Tax=Eudoraea adriatica TaxID=446681 RepID=UPI000360E379|nr:acyl-CoA thioesterase [Eudoraea adriatica]